MKIITMYLPQFHEVEENNKWWGYGYTEWTAVQQAEVLYSSHYQPRVPLNDNYYNLLDKNTMKWQSELMNKYGVDGACFYHYWFKEGKQLLEKPAERLLEWTDINMPFCFSWANSAWARSWSKMKDASTWAVRFEKKGEATGQAVLMEQDYGDEEQWKDHFNYLLPFFEDKRYIRQGDKPVFMIYRPSLIPCLKDMVEKWNHWAKEAGLEGIYFIGANSDQYDKEILNAELCHEPVCVLNRVHGTRKNDKEPQKIDYDEAWQQLLDYRKDNEKTYYGGFVSYDDTPRRGKEGIVIDGATPEKFKYYLSELLAKNFVENNEFVFLNAWNEWGEGMYLEPDEKYRHEYLSAISFARVQYKNYIEKYKKKQTESTVWYEYNCLQNINRRYLGYWKILDRWLSLKEEGISLTTCLEKRKIHTIAVYGMGMLGKHLSKELEHSSVKIKYGIDKKAVKIQLGYPILTIEEEMPEVDAVIVTVIYEFRKIADMLKKKGFDNVLSLEDIILEEER